MLNVFKNNTIFPDYIKLNLSNNLINQINTIINPFKSNVTDALIYSFVQEKNITSNKRKSLKTSFRSEELKNIIKQNIIPLIYSLLKSEFPNCYYNVEVGEQIFDYIKYDNGGYFEPHRDWVRVSSDQQTQYTLLIGLTEKEKYYTSGNTIIWIPVNYLNQHDYKVLIEPDVPNDLFKIVCYKYGLPVDSNQVKKLFDTNKSTQKCIPCKINTLTNGTGLLFQSNFLHSGEEYYGNCIPKELFSLTINITGIDSVQTPNPYINQDNFLSKYQIPCEHNMINSWLSDPDNKFILFDKFESWMCWNNSQFIRDYFLFPFQIILSSGSYNNKNFSDKYIRYGNLDTDINKIFDANSDSDLLEKINLNLNEIYDKTKSKLNTRGRETFIDGEVEEVQDNFDNLPNIDSMYFDLDFINGELKNKIQFNLENYLNNFSYSNNSVITRFEKILNTWEESGCNDDGDEYEETTYLNCQIDIKFGFYKLD